MKASKELLLRYLEFLFVEGISIKKKYLLFSRAQSMEAFLNSKASDFSELSSIYSHAIKEMNSAEIKRKAEEELELCERFEIHILVWESAFFPASLKEIPDPPLLIFVQGELEALGQKSPYLSMIGTRRMSVYGRAVVDHCISNLIPYKPVIVSGFALGVDTSSHRQALSHGLWTVAVLATGLGVPYPKENVPLISQVIKRGCLISERPYWAQAEKHNFIQRNRMIAALSETCLVVESPKKGGSLITAQMAFDYHRPVYAVPGRIGDLKSEGCLWLIQRKIAEIYTGAAGLSRDLMWRIPEKQKTLFDTSHELDHPLLKHFKLGRSMHVEDLSELSKQSVGLVQQELTKLELQGFITCDQVGFYRFT